MTEALPVYAEQLRDIKNLLWGPNIKSDIFNRWSQGFYFTTSEPSAVEQAHGGPCSIIAPVQAFIIKNLLIEYNSLEFRDKVQTEAIQNTLLLSALTQIINQCTTNDVHYVAYLECEQAEASNVNISYEGALIDHNSEEQQLHFHKNVRLTCLNGSEEFQHFLEQNITKFKQHFGILLLLYSVIATKGVDQVKLESDTTDPLIDTTHGYGSQSLINLMITGRAVTYVWDFEQDVGGLKLKGLDKQSNVGFITLMEHLRYCTVGSFFKNPMHPVWVLGSETHLTVLFSENKRLVSPETKSEQARRIFKNYDKDGNNFINSDDLKQVLSDLDLVNDDGYVDIMKKKLDSEHLGIILLNAFMDEFFPMEESSTPDTFQLVHYNGLAQSNYGGSVKYRIGTAILLESDLRAMCESNPMLTCLQTKWPTIEVNWQDNVTPSLN